MPATSFDDQTGAAPETSSGPSPVLRFLGSGIGSGTASYPQAGDLFSFIFYLFYIF